MLDDNFLLTVSELEHLQDKFNALHNPEQYAPLIAEQQNRLRRQLEDVLQNPDASVLNDRNAILYRAAGLVDPDGSRGFAERIESIFREQQEEALFRRLSGDIIRASETAGAYENALEVAHMQQVPQEDIETLEDNFFLAKRELVTAISSFVSYRKQAGGDIAADTRLRPIIDLSRVNSTLGEIVWNDYMDYRESAKLTYLPKLVHSFRHVRDQPGLQIDDEAKQLIESIIATWDDYYNDSETRGQAIEKLKVDGDVLTKLREDIDTLEPLLTAAFVAHNDNLKQQLAELVDPENINGHADVGAFNRISTPSAVTRDDIDENGLLKHKSSYSLPRPDFSYKEKLADIVYDKYKKGALRDGLE